ncbi:protein GPR15LG [Oryctolagus cuniculus]|uniref:protein GPR15LG n=1 Tax=Oryctolagus cuniculus TaxID=9986 RepID=UPI00387911E5
MRLLVLSSLLCILLLFFPVEGRRHPIRSQRVWRCCPVARPLRTILKAPKPSQASREILASLDPSRLRPQSPVINTRDSVHFAASTNPVQRRARSGRYAGPCRLCKIKPSLIHQWVVPGALPQV